MDYFDFEEATVSPFDDLPNSVPSAVEQCDLGAFESLPLDEPTLSVPVDEETTFIQPIKLRLINDCEVEVIPAFDSNHEYPMYLAKTPCKLCVRMGLDCYLASRGTLITGCTACISLYRECSFTHAEMPKGYVSTFPGISEDQQVCHGPITERKRAMISMEESRGRKTGARFPRDAVKILKQWLSEHNDHPYPNEREKDELKKITGLKRSQISNWLANARRRGKVRSVSGPSSPILGAIDIPCTSRGDQMADLDPMSRWKISPPENEPASMTAIARAITSAPVPARKDSQSSLHNSRASSRKASSEDDSGFSMFKAPSASSFETRDSSNSDLSLASSRSLRSRASLASSQDRRRRRRAPITQRASVAPAAKTRSARIFQCTFCTDTFPSKYDWQRHEKSLHLALERWTCCPSGGTKIDPMTRQPQCVFCEQKNPSTDHLETHNFVACQEKTLQERTFYRKDHLRQHLKLMHDTKFHPSMEAWKTATTEIKSECGFCPSIFATWQQRADHLAAHFRNGADMANWRGSWGFEPHIEKLVENAMPPYLIGHEKLSMNPYIARAAATQPSPSENGLPGLSHSTSVTGSSEDRVEVDQMTRDSNCWHRLEDELIKYVTEQKAMGSVPNDKALQDRARETVYGSPDGWDWTCADNQTWLDAFKFQAGIGPEPAAPDLRETRQVPLAAPYVIKGGLRNKRISSCGSVQDKSCALSRRDSTYVTPIGSLAGTGYHTPLLPHQSNLNLNMFELTPTEALENGMDLDFEPNDFNGLDLEAFGDMNFDESPGVVPGLGMMGMGMGMDVQLPPAQMQTSGPDLFGSFGEDQMRLQQNSIQTGGGTMTRENLDQLTGYMAGFQRT